MGLLSLFAKPVPTLLRLPSGSFTVDREGCVLMGTLPSSFPAALVKDIAQQVRAAFGEAAAAQLPLAELHPLPEPEGHRPRTAGRRHRIPFAHSFLLTHEPKLIAPAYEQSKIGPTR